MDRLVVRIASDAREVEAALPFDLPVSALLPGIVALCEGRMPSESELADWMLETPEGTRIGVGETLRQVGLQEAALLRLIQRAPVPAGPVEAETETAGGTDAEWGSPEGQGAGFAPPETEPEANGTYSAPAPEALPEPLAPEALPEPPPVPVEEASELPSAVPLTGRIKAVAGALVNTGTDEVPVDPEPGAVDRLAVQRQASPIQRAHQAWEATDYKHRLDAFIAAPRLTRCVTIAVVSPKGGVGKTTTSILLGTILATVRTDRVVAVDTDPDYGTLGRSFAAVNPMYVDDLARILDQPALTVTMLDRFLSRAAHGLMVLPAPVDPDRMETLDRQNYAEVIARLKDMVGILVLDCGAGMRAPATKAALEAADQLVLVTDADPATASLVADVARRFEDRSHVLVVNKSPRRGGRLNLERLAEDVPAAGAVVEVEVDPVAAEAVSLGRFSWASAQDGWEIAARELAAHLAAGWERLGATG